MPKQISDNRKALYYLGMGVSVLGGLMFISVFFTAAMNFGNFNNFESNARSSMFRGFGGMVLLIAGNFMRSIGARGAAGSGIILDPERARSELEPYSRMAGGMVKDALDEADLDGRKRDTEKVVMVRCLSCRKLNEEVSKFCQECGKPI